MAAQEIGSGCINGKGKALYLISIPKKMIEPVSTIHAAEFKHLS